MRLAIIATASLLVFAACSNNDATLEDTGATASDADTAATASADTQSNGVARATIRDSAGRELGSVALRDTVGGIAVSGNLRGLPPGPHAIHLHTTGLCEPPFESAGDHWNPTNRQHGTENPQGPHFGDMPNLTVSADSSVTVSVLTPGGALRGATRLLDQDGAAVVVHAGPDDYRTDPSGDSGARIACGAISD